MRAAHAHKPKHTFAACYQQNLRANNIFFHNPHTVVKAGQFLLMRRVAMMHDVALFPASQNATQETYNRYFVYPTVIRKYET
jgi:hypothetical protein